MAYIKHLYIYITYKLFNSLIQLYMKNSHSNTLIRDIDKLTKYFKQPISSRQKQYEAIRAIIIDKEDASIVAKKYWYTVNTIYSLMRDAKAWKIELFPSVAKWPAKKHTNSDLQNKIISLRRQKLSTPDISIVLKKEWISLSARSVERILKNAGFSKLKRRTNKELGKVSKNKLKADRSEQLSIAKLEPFKVDCPVAWVFFFIPYILESGILSIVKECALPESSDIDARQACLAMLLLKLIWWKRMSHIKAYDQEPWFWIFAWLNILPKPTYMCTYSCRCSEEQLMNLQSKIISSFIKKFPTFYDSDYINLDFHSIPHFWEESNMENVWCWAKNKTMKGANTVFVQDSKSNALIYSRADILRKEESLEVKKFVEHWKKIKWSVKETLVFDCKFTSYEILDDLSSDNVKFITLRKRSAELIKKVNEIQSNEWQKVYINIPKRKYKHVSVYEGEIKLKWCKNSFRQIIIKDHWRANPTIIITNNFDLSLKEILEVYAKRWHIENKIAELVTFFNLNALSSPIMIRIHFDILWTMIADTLYHLFAQDLRRFEKTLSPTIFSKFINMPGQVVYDWNKFLIKIRKRAHTPILKEVKKLSAPFQVPWLDNKTVEIVWTA